MRAGSAEVTLVEKNPVMAAIARRSLKLEANAALASRVKVVEADVLAPRVGREAAGLADGGFGHVLTNPPFHRHDHRSPPDALRAEAMVAGDADFLPRWIRICAALLCHGGRLAAVVRTDALPVVLPALEGRVGGLRLVPVHTRDGAAAPRLLLVGRKGSRAPLEILPGLVLHDAAGRPTQLLREVSAGTAEVDPKA